MHVLKVLSLLFHSEEDDWNIIVTECNSLSYKWEELSAFLGLSRNRIKSIKKNHPCDDTGCLNDALGQWIGQKYTTEKFGMPSWRTLLKAIALIDRHIFKKLAREHEGKIISFCSLVPRPLRDGPGIHCLCMCQSPQNPECLDTAINFSYNLCVRTVNYHIAGNFGEVFNLVNW